MSDYILKAIEYVERNAARAHERLDRERVLDAGITATATEMEPSAATSSVATLDAAVYEIERIQRQVAAARQDFASVYGRPDTDGEAVA